VRWQRAVLRVPVPNPLHHGSALCVPPPRRRHCPRRRRQVWYRPPPGVPGCPEPGCRGREGAPAVQDRLNLILGIAGPASLSRSPPIFSGILHGLLLSVFVLLLR